MTLMVLLITAGFFIWLLHDYERERIFLENQTDLLDLENALQLALMEIIGDKDLSEDRKEYPVGTVLVKRSGMHYELRAQLPNGSERKAFLTVDEKGNFVKYEEGI